jgi:hypothetical protein
MWHFAAVFGTIPSPYIGPDPSIRSYNSVRMKNAFQLLPGLPSSQELSIV